MAKRHFPEPEAWLGSFHLQAILSMYTRLIDFGLFILIWMVQLIAYPSFRFFVKSDLSDWHDYYTKMITLFVVPLMFGQLGLHLYGMIKSAFSWVQVVAFVMILAVWLITFMKAVPLHGQIGNGVNVQTGIESLIRVNWIRTVLWTLVFLLSMWRPGENL